MFSRTLRSASACLAVAAALSLPVATPASAQDTFPEDLARALVTYELEWPVEDWADGPVQYLLLRYERDIWKKLRTDEERRDFIAWFWMRRDPDPRDEDAPLRNEFYTRVAYANQRFAGFPRGWRSDRGRVYTTLGPPTGGIRRIQGGAGRCQAYQGELWTFNTMNMAFSASMGEFFVLFIETRTNTYEVCDPTMLGPGAMPAELGRALEITQEAWVLDNVTEFEPGTGALVAEMPATDIVSRTEPLTVPDWQPMGAAGQIVVPVEIPLRGLFFEPQEDRLVASLRVTAELTPVGEGSPWSGTEDWRLELDAGAAGGIGNSLLRTAIVLPAPTGGWSVSVRVVDPLSAVAYSWEGPVEVTEIAAVVSPPLAAASVERLREGGEVAVITAAPPRLAAGGQMVVAAWVRGMVPTAEQVSVWLVGADGNEFPLVIDGVAWGDALAAGPLLAQVTLPDLASGTYALHLRVGEVAARESAVYIER